MRGLSLSDRVFRQDVNPVYEGVYIPFDGIRPPVVFADEVSAWVQNSVCACNKTIVDVAKGAGRISPPFQTFFVEFMARGGPVTTLVLHRERRLILLNYANIDAECGHSHLSGPLVDMQATLSETGVIEEAHLSGHPAKRAEEDAGWRRSLGALSAQMLVPVMAMAFLSCKNIRLTSNPVSRQVRRAEERGGREAPLDGLSLLVVNHTAPVISSGGAKSHEGRCETLSARGHFKDYQGGAGLFGRHNGLFWWNGRGERDMEVKVNEPFSCGGHRSRSSLAQ